MYKVELNRALGEKKIKSQSSSMSSILFLCRDVTFRLNFGVKKETFCPGETSFSTTMNFQIKRAG